jgi:hypothetical protein
MSADVQRSRQAELVPAGMRSARRRAFAVAVLVAAAVLAGPLGAAADPPTPTRAYPVPYTELTVRYHELQVKQGGQRVHVMIPMAAGTDQFGDTVSYRWDTHVSGGPRCQPGALPDLSEVTAGTVIDAPLPMPPGGWCRGLYGVTLNAIVTLNCGADPPPGCRSGRRITDRVADAPFEVAPSTTVCHRRGDVERCWNAPTLRDPGGWYITAPLDDLLGPEGATEDADHFFERAFHDHPVFQRHWETDDDTFYGWATRRRQAARMAAIVDRVLRAGPYHDERLKA